MKYSGKDKELAARIHERLNGSLGNGTAISFSIVMEGDVLCSAAADCNDEDFGTKAPYNIGSVSKVFCAAAVMKLFEMEMVELDAPIVKYLPEFTMGDERYREITLRMCLNHSSGLPGTMLKDAYSSVAGTCDDFQKTFLTYLSKAGLKCDPGANSSYCNDGFDLASMVVSKVSGMSYTSFLKKYVTGPLGISSLYTPEDCDTMDRHIVRKGYGEEFLNSLGSGGIAMSVEDCALFGWSFIGPGRVLGPKSIAEMAVPQCLSMEPEDSVRNYGLGWDNVNFTCPEIDLGEGTLIKSGGTPSFVTYLLVSPQKRISASISATRGVVGYVLPFFLKLIAFVFNDGVEYAEEEGIWPSENLASKPVPADFAAKYSGTYYSCLNVHEVSLDGGHLTLRCMSENGWDEEVKPASFDGEFFNGEYDGEPARFFFRTIDGIDYLNVIVQYKGISQIAEKPACKASPDSAWIKRNHRKYLMVDGNKWDIAVGSMAAGIELLTSADDGVVLAKLRGLGGTVNVIPTIICDSDTTRMFLTASSGGVNQFELTVFRIDGKEYLECAGYTFVEVDALPVFNDDALENANNGTCYKVEGKVKLPARLSESCVVLLDNSLHVTWDSRVLGHTEVADEGYIIIL